MLKNEAYLVTLLCLVLAVTSWSFATPKQCLTDVENTKIAEFLGKDLFWTAFPAFENLLHHEMKSYSREKIISI